MVCVHAGQGCAMQTRMLLPRSRYDEGVELITAGHGRGALRRPEQRRRRHGPRHQREQRDRVLGYIARGKRREPSSCSAAAARPHLPKGCFVEPTLFIDVDNSMTIAQEEIFGPVLCVIPYEDDDDAVRIANESALRPLGRHLLRLRGAGHRARAADPDRLDGRQRWPVVRADSPYGGYKASGIGRQCGIEGFEQYLETKAIAWPRLT